MHHSERAFRAHATGPQVKRRAGLTGSCSRGAGFGKGEKEGSKELPGQKESKCLLSLLPRHGVHREVYLLFYTAVKRVFVGVFVGVFPMLPCNIVTWTE